MSVIDRRTLLRNILPGAAVTAAGIAAIAAGATDALMPQAEAMPLTINKTNPLSAEVEALFQNTQVVVVRPRRRRVRRRRWQCWWHRGRRRCGYRWVWI